MTTVTASTSTDVTYELIDDVAVITLDRPEVKNAMSLDVFEALTARAAQAAADPGARGVLVRGAEGSFSSGLDLSVFTDPRIVDGGLDETTVARLQDAFNAYEDLDKPVVAAVEGVCLGGGIQLAMACHMRMAAPSASFAVLEGRWGLVPDLGGTFRLPRLVGLGRATEMIVTARRVDGEEALRIGLADVALPSNRALDAALEFTSRLAQGPGSIARGIKLARENLGRGRDGALKAEALAQMDCLAGPDVAEALSAHSEARDPVFVGR